MRAYVACCLGSGIMGALVALYWQQGTPVGRLEAQELGRGQFAGGTSGGIGATPQERRAADELTQEERVNVAVYENVNRGVVNIDSKGVRTDAFFFLDLPAEGMGSGSVLDKSGHILTNYHVIEGAKVIEVALFNGRTFAAQLVGNDPSSDLAVLKIDAPADMLFPVTIGDSTQLKVGQRVFAIGNPFGLERAR